MSQSTNDLPYRAIGIFCPTIFSFEQTLSDNESLRRDAAGYILSQYEFNDFCREAWVEHFNYLCIRIIKKDELKITVRNENKTNSL